MMIAMAEAITEITLKILLNPSDLSEDAGGGGIAGGGVIGAPS